MLNETDLDIEAIAEGLYHEACAWRSSLGSRSSQYLPSMSPVSWEDAETIATHITRRAGGSSSDFVATAVRVGYTNTWRISIGRRNITQRGIR